MALSGADKKAIREIFDDLILPSPDVELRLKAVETTTDKLSNILCGNGDKGMDETVRDIEGRLYRLENQMGRIDSNLTEVKKSVDKLSGYQGIKYDVSNHPARRAGDDGEADKLLSWFTGRVLPGLVQNTITAVVTLLLLLAVTHWTELFP